jgi:hypothetical protein
MLIVGLGITKRIWSGKGGGRGVPLRAATKNATCDSEGGDPLLSFRCLASFAFMRSARFFRLFASSSRLVSMVWCWCAGPHCVSIFNQFNLEK